MSNRRSLVEGLKSTPPVDPVVEQAFVRQTKTEAGHTVAPQAPVRATEGRDDKARPELPLGRLALSMRIRTDYASALKRASLQRQLDGVDPYQIQDIVEDALEPWLRQHGYLD